MNISGSVHGSSPPVAAADVYCCTLEVPGWTGNIFPDVMSTWLLSMNLYSYSLDKNYLLRWMLTSFYKLCLLVSIVSVWLQEQSIQMCAEFSQLQCW